MSNKKREKRPKEMEDYVGIENIKGGLNVTKIEVFFVVIL